MTSFMEAKEYQFTLYTYWRSSASWRVRIAFALKNLSYESKAVNLLKGAQKDKEYVDEVNPGAVLPALAIHHNGEKVDILTQSISIMEFLDLYESTPRLIPLDPFTRAHVMEIVYCIGCDIHPVQNLRVLQSYPEADRPARAKQVITEGLRAVEAYIRKGKKEGPYQFCIGEEVTLADLMLVPQVYNAVRWGVDMAEFPAITEINAYLSQLPAFIAAHADNQPDAVLQPSVAK